MGETSIEYLSPVRGTGFPTEWYEMAGSDHFWMRSRTAIALATLDALGPRRSDPLVGLDIGCGAGQLRDELEAATRWRIDITDLNVAALEAARPGRGRVLYYDATDRAPEMVRAYDAVFLFDVIEHVEAARELLAAALAHLRPGGRLLVNVPALPALFSAYDAAQGHQRRYTRRSLAAELAGLPCRVDSVAYWGMSLVPLLAARKLLLGSRPSPDTMRAGFRPPGRLVNDALTALLRAETALVRRPPVGTSVMAAATKLSA
ncbi:MAG: methyltransferase domain-containing protein [Vicinamibacteria bacterium]